MIDPSVQAAAIAAVGGVMVTLLGGRIKRLLSRDDAAAAGLAAQLAGWGTLNAGQANEVRSLRADLTEHRKRIDELEGQNREWQYRYDEAERRYAKCEENNVRLQRSVSELQIRVGDLVLPSQNLSLSAVAVLIVLVEDDEGLARTCCRALATQGFETAYFSTGRPALNYILERTPDVMIVDLALPDMDGEQLAREARAGGYTGPIIAMSGSLMADNDQRFSAQLQKPFRTHQLIDAVRAAISPTQQ